MKHLRGAAGIILSLIFAVCFMCSPAFAASRLYQGMDVSSWQGDIDFQAVRAAGIQVVYQNARHISSLASCSILASRHFFIWSGDDISSLKLLFTVFIRIS